MLLLHRCIMLWPLVTEPMPPRCFQLIYRPYLWRFYLYDIHTNPPVGLLFPLRNIETTSQSHNKEITDALILLGPRAFFPHVKKTTYLTCLALTPFQAVLPSPGTPIPPYKGTVAGKAMFTTTCILDMVSLAPLPSVSTRVSTPIM
jgi:hypothetical protein